MRSLSKFLSKTLYRKSVNDRVSTLNIILWAETKINLAKNINRIQSEQKLTHSGKKYACHIPGNNCRFWSIY